MSDEKTFRLDGKVIPFNDGDSVLEAALRADEYIPHLCFNPEFKPHGNCRVCMVDVDGRQYSACTLVASENMKVDNSSEKNYRSTSQSVTDVICRRQSYLPRL